MGRTCGEPDEIELTAMGVELNGSRCRHATFFALAGGNVSATELDGQRRPYR